MTKLAKITLLLFSLASLGLIVGCGSDDQPNPKDTVIKLFGAMEKDDQAALTGLLDLPELMKTQIDDYALNSDSVRQFTSVQQILDDLTFDGVTKTRWFSFQRIIASTEINGEVANVQVTFVDKAKSKGYITKFGLHLVNGKWRVFSFRNISNYR
jgi:hypothetical protein